MPGDDGGGAGKDAQEPPGETEAGERAFPQPVPAQGGPARRAGRRHPPTADGGRKGSAERAGPARPGVCGPRPTPRQAGTSGRPGGPGTGRRWGPGPLALEPLTWRAGARKAELAAAAQGAAERRTQSAAPPPRGRRGDARGRGRERRGVPARARDPASAAPGMRRKGRGLFVSARPARAPASCVSGSRGLSVPWARARAGACGLLPSIGAGRGGEGLGSWVSGYLCVSPGLPVSDAPTPRLCPLPGARRSPARVSMASSLGAERSGDKEAGLGLALPTPDSAPPRPPPALHPPRPPPDRRVQAPRQARRRPGRTARWPRGAGAARWALGVTSLTRGVGSAGCSLAFPHTALGEGAG